MLSAMSTMLEKISMEILWPYIVKKKTRRHRKMSPGSMSEAGNLFHGIVELAAGFEFDGFACGDSDGFFCAGVDACAFAFLAYRESAESYEGYFVVSGEGLGDGCGGCVEGCLGVGLGQVGFLGDSVDELSLVHKEISYWCFYCANILIKLYIEYIFVKKITKKLFFFCLCGFYTPVSLFF